MRAAVIGCGRIGATYDDAHPDVGVFTHAGAYTVCPATELVALCDTDPAAASAARARFGSGSAGTDLDALLASTKPEIASVCTPDATHYDVAARVLETPSLRALIVEKPLAPSSAQARRLAMLAQARGVTLAVAYTRRFAPSFQALRAHVAGGALGELRTVAGYYTGGVAHNGTHWIDLVRMLCGEVAWVRAEDRLREGGDDPTLDLELGLSDGVTARATALAAGDYAVFELDLVGALGRVRIDQSGHVFAHQAAGESLRHPGYRELLPADGPAGGLRDVLLHVVEDAVAACQDGRAPACGAHEAIAALEVSEAAVRSARRGDIYELAPASAAA